MFGAGVAGGRGFPEHRGAPEAFELRSTGIRRSAGTELALLADRAVRADGALEASFDGGREVLRNESEGLEQRWDFDREPRGAGALEVRISTAGQAAPVSTPTGLHFRAPESPFGTRYGLATWVDAHGTRTPIV